jgi:hypothetical protein
MTPEEAAVEPYVCDAEHARELTEQIRGSVEKVQELLVRSYEWKAWKALGYMSWSDYATAEFGISQAHAYRLLDKARTVRAIEAVADSPMGEIDERQARELAPIVRKHGAEVAAAVFTAVIESGRKPTAAAIKSEAQSRGLAHVTTTTRTTEATKVEQIVDLDTGELLPGPGLPDPVAESQPISYEQWQQENAIHEFVQASPDVRRANLRRDFSKWVHSLHQAHTFDPHEMADVYPERVDELVELAAGLTQWANSYRQSVRDGSGLRIVKGI